MCGIVGCVMMVIYGFGIEMLIANLIMSLVMKILGGVLIYFMVCLAMKNEIISMLKKRLGEDK